MIQKASCPECEARFIPGPDIDTSCFFFCPVCFTPLIVEVVVNSTMILTQAPVIEEDGAG